VDNVIDFIKYKEARDEIETEIMREDIMEWMMNTGDYTPSTFTFTLTTEDHQDE